MTNSVISVAEFNLKDESCNSSILKQKHVSEFNLKDESYKSSIPLAAAPSRVPLAPSSPSRRVSSHSQASFLSLQSLCNPQAAARLSIAASISLLG